MLSWKLTLNVKLILSEIRSEWGSFWVLLIKNGRIVIKSRLMKKLNVIITHPLAVVLASWLLLCGGVLDPQIAWGLAPSSQMSVAQGAEMVQAYDQYTLQEETLPLSSDSKTVDQPNEDPEREEAEDPSLVELLEKWFEPIRSNEAIIILFAITLFFIEILSHLVLTSALLGQFYLMFTIISWIAIVLFVIPMIYSGLEEFSAFVKTIALGKNPFSDEDGVTLGEEFTKGHCFSLAVDSSFCGWPFGGFSRYCLNWSGDSTGGGLGRKNMKNIQQRAADELAQGFGERVVVIKITSRG